MKKINFTIIKKSKEAPLARAGCIETPHGKIETPAFITVGTKATVKALPVEMVKEEVGAQAVLANTYHLYLQPGSELVKKHGGFAKMMGWNGPTFTDSGGFQVFSLGQAMGHGVSKIATSESISKAEANNEKITETEKLAKITEDGVEFKSIIDGSKHFFSPEESMRIQHDLGADIFFAFDECTSPLAPYEYQVEALERTTRWAQRSLDEHKRLGPSEATGHAQALFGVIQGGAYEDLRRRSALELGAMDFDGFGIGGSFTKDDMDKTVKAATEVLPEGKPRHLLGIGEPIDFFIGVEYGIDTFDCVSPTRVARNGAIYTKEGRVNLHNARFKEDFSPLCDDPTCYGNSFTKAYVAHLFRSEEMLAATIASAHNLHFVTKLVSDIRQSIIDNRFFEFKKEFCDLYYKKEY
jgi:queuine tRNA-ribosyltransferase